MNKGRKSQKRRRRRSFESESKLDLSLLSFSLVNRTRHYNRITAAAPPRTVFAADHAVRWSRAAAWECFKEKEFAAQKEIRVLPENRPRYQSRERGEYRRLQFTSRRARTGEGRQGEHGPGARKRCSAAQRGEPAGY